MSRWAVIPERAIQEWDRGEYNPAASGLAIWHHKEHAEAVAERLSRPGARFVAVKVVN